MDKSFFSTSWSEVGIILLYVLVPLLVMGLVIICIGALIKFCEVLDPEEYHVEGGSLNFANKMNSYYFIKYHVKKCFRL